jgi:hypothetical protein
MSIYNFIRNTPSGVFAMVTKKSSETTDYLLKITELSVEDKDFKDFIDPLFNPHRVPEKGLYGF